MNSRINNIIRVSSEHVEQMKHMNKASFKPKRKELYLSQKTFQITKRLLHTLQIEEYFNIGKILSKSLWIQWFFQ